MVLFRTAPFTSHSLHPLQIKSSPLQVLWTGSYVARVVNKDMTYVKQLDDYEAAVMAKRLEELPAAELESLMADVEGEKARKAARKAAGGGPDPLL